MGASHPEASVSERFDRRRAAHAAIICALLLVNLVLAIHSLLGDSATFDEPLHLASGVAALAHADFRLSPEHPPLGRYLAAWTSLAAGNAWIEPDFPGWRACDVNPVAVRWAFELNDGHRLVVLGRFGMLPLLPLTCLAVYLLGRRLAGPNAGLLALAIAALCPSLLAHGRLITTDMPITCAVAWSLLTFARLMERSALGRFVAAGLAIGAASVAKFSWPLLLPALAVMAVCTAASSRRVLLPRRRAARVDDNGPPALHTAPHKALYALAAAAGLAMVVWLTIWTTYGWRLPMLPPPPADDAAAAALHADAEAAIARDWAIALHNPDGSPRAGAVALVCRWAADAGLLPDAYVFGLARALFLTGQRVSFLNGEISEHGRLAYFPTAFAIKTPIAAMALIGAGAAALVLRRAAVRDPVLLAGVATFVAVYALYVMRGDLNIGHRHLLPVYPLLYALAGAAAVCGAGRAGRVFVGAAVAWLVGAAGFIHPHYLAYFNEFVGGPANGHRYLLDSNIDWGQDLLRLAAYAEQNADEHIQLAYFGSAVPTHYLPCRPLPSYYPFGEISDIEPGEFVISATQLAGVYSEENRRAFWTERTRTALRRLAAIAAGADALDGVSLTDEQRAAAAQFTDEQRAAAAREHRELAASYLISRLKSRPPDGRIGYSLFRYRLSAEELRELFAE